MNFIQHTRNWIASFVVQFNLCPFAKHPLENEQVRFIVYEGTDLDELVTMLEWELKLLLELPPSEVETTFLIHPNILNDFYLYNDFLSVSDQLIFALGLEGVLQIASFHPDYQFSDTEQTDITNYTNRSPYPMLHLLREASMEKALEDYENPESIPNKNMETMRELGIERILDLKKKL